MNRVPPPPTATVADGHEIIVRGIKLKNTKFDIPITINSRVENWIDYFTGRGRPFFEKYLERSEFFIPYIKPILKTSGMPEDLVYLAMIESGFNNLARSRARAVGPWQFMSATGKRFGLAVNWWVDERRDIRKSTLAAVEYLRDLYTIFQSWELAAAAYNAGEAKVARAVRRFGSKDFWVISRYRFLRPETRDYVPKMIAAAIIEKNRAQFGFPTSYSHPGAGEAVAPDGEVVKLVKTDKPIEDPVASREKAQDLANDPYEFDDEDASSGQDISPATLTVPADNSPQDGQMAHNDEPGPLAKPVPMPHISKSGHVGGEEMAEFEVQSPADILKISRAAGLSYQTVKSLNPEILRWCTPPNLGTYRLKLPAFVKEKFLVTYNHVAFPRKVQFLTYKVRRGETLTRIARHFGIKVDPIADLNRVSPKIPLRHGTNVLLPMPNDRSRTLASLEIRDPPERARHRVRRHRRFMRISYRHRESARTHRRRTPT
ncbi:MAG: transglycosylase SLT domain-containing protein [Bdellovibrionota bacterium]